MDGATGSRVACWNERVKKRDERCGMRRAVRPRLATGNEPRMQMNSRATSIPQQQGGGWFRRLKKRQPITARRVDEMEVRLPLEESLCPHRSSSSAFSTGVSSSTPCCILPLSRHLHPRSASFYFYFHPLCTVLPPLPYRIADRVVSVALLATARILPRGPSAYLCCTWPATPVSIAKKFTFAKKRAREKSMLAAHWPRGRWIAAALALVASRAWLKDELSLCHRLYWSYSRATRLWRTTRRVWRGCSRTHNDSPRSARAAEHTSIVHQTRVPFPFPRSPVGGTPSTGLESAAFLRVERNSRCLKEQSKMGRGAMQKCLDRVTRMVCRRSFFSFSMEETRVLRTNAILVRKSPRFLIDRMEWKGVLVFMRIESIAFK